MLEELTLKQKKKNEDLSNQFDNWLYKDRGRQIKGVKYFLNKRSDDTDDLIHNLALSNNLNLIQDFGIFSVGGYGRGELHPYSDIDLLLLSKNKLTKADQKKIESFISFLWDLGLQVGHSVRTVSQATDQARRDVQTMTNMLEHRKLFGNDNIHKEYLKILETKNLWRNKPFIQAKIIEQEERHESFNNTSYNLEPDIKSSPGGLRDVHTINWLISNSSRNNSSNHYIGLLTDEEQIELNNSKHLLWVIRYLLHLEAKREEDRLLFEYQIPVAQNLFPSIENPNQAAEKLMHRYYRSTLNVAEINSTFIQSLKENNGLTRFSRKRNLDNNFFVKNNLIHLKDLNGFKKNPSLLLDLFIKLSENTSLDGIGFETLRSLKKDRHLINSEFTLSFWYYIEGWKVLVLKF